ncbi:MAG: beta-lactamase family protein, partial [Lachnospiraceae bacterium]|nr:beta-lactamase family protein [Lachnospiraceae bacterium]
MNKDKLTKYLDSLLDAGLPSFDCMVMKDHELLYRHMGGFADAERTQPIRADQKYLMFSMTKIQTMTAVMQLVEQGKLSLDDEVAKYLPAYRELYVRETDADGTERIVPADKPLTMLHLVTMQSGLDYDLHRPGVEAVLAAKGGDATTRELVDAMAKSPLSFHPGTHYQYSLSHDVAAAVVEVVSGKKFSEYLAENVWNPLGMKSTCFCKGMNEGVEGLAQQYVCDNGDLAQIRPMEPSCDYQLAPSYESGGAGLMSCTEDYLK